MRSLRKKSDLRDYQQWMARRVEKKRFLLLAAEMGLGKTASVLTAARRLLDRGKVSRILIIAPLYVAEYTWPEEIAAWQHTKVLSYSVITGTPKQRLAALNKDVEIHIINRENFRWLWRLLGPKKWKWDMIVYDEASRLKAGRKRTAKRKTPGKNGKIGGRGLSEFGAVARASAYVDRFVELSGTPAPNGLIDLWGPIYCLDLGERLGGTRQAFLDRWFESDYMGYNWEPKPHAERQIMDRLSDVMVSLKAEDYIDLPPAIPNIIKVHLPKRIMQEYRRFERTLVSEAYDVEAVSKGVLTNKLLQFANGSMYRDIEGTYPVEKEIVAVHDEKMAALESVIEEASGNQVMVAYSFKFDLKRILKKYPKAVVPERDSDWKRKWDKGKAGMLLVHPQSISHGLNLQFGGHIACWYGLTWSLETYQQFNTRLSRPGQPNPFVMIHHIIAAGTAEEESVLPSLQEKGATQDRITRAVKARIANLT